MPLYLLKSNRGGEDRRESLVLLGCIALQKFYFANVSTVFASRFRVMHHFSVFLIDILYKKITKAVEQNYGKLQYLWHHSVYEPKMNTSVFVNFLHTAITVRLFNDWK